MASSVVRQLPDSVILALEGARIPTHLAVIPDGNRRWAQGAGVTTTEGHRRGFEVAKRLSRFCRDIGIHTVTVWAFSTENWRRRADQVAVLMALYEEWLEELLNEAVEEEVRVVHLGRKEGLPRGVAADAAAAGFPHGLPESLREALEFIERKTEGYERNVINLAINYGGADELHRAFSKMAEEAQRRGIGSNELELENFLDTAGQPHPNPDVVWRPSGEFRLSGFLPVQSSYAEIVFTDKFFPDLTEADVVDVVVEYSARSRRFGG